MGVDQKRFVGIAHYVSRKHRREKSGLDTWFRICHIGLGAHTVSQAEAKHTLIFPNCMSHSVLLVVIIVLWAKVVKKK